MNRAEYLKTLPKKRGGSGAILLNEDNKILMLKTTYKEILEIPGGAIEENESPIECCKREILEELGLELTIKQLLVLDYQKQEFDDCYMFIFNGGVLSKEKIAQINLLEEEIEQFDFYTLDEIKNLTSDRLYIRIKQAIDALQKNTFHYTETSTS